MNFAIRLFWTHFSPMPRWLILDIYGKQCSYCRHPRLLSFKQTYPFHGSGPLARYVKFAGYACVGNARNVFLPPRVSDRRGWGWWWWWWWWWWGGGGGGGGGGVTFPAFAAHAQPTILLIWQETHSWHHIILTVEGVPSGCPGNRVSVQSRLKSDFAKYTCYLLLIHVQCQRGVTEI